MHKKIIVHQDRHSYTQHLGIIMNIKKISHLIFCCIIGSTSISHAAQECSWRTKLVYPFVTAKRAICANQVLKDFLWAPQAPNVKNKPLNEAIEDYILPADRMRRHVIGPRALTVFFLTGIATGSAMYAAYNNMISYQPNTGLPIKAFIAAIGSATTFIAATCAGITYGNFAVKHSRLLQTLSRLAGLRLYLSRDKNPLLNREQISQAMEQQNTTNCAEFDAAREAARNDPRLEAAREYAREYWQFLHTFPSFEAVPREQKAQFTNTHIEKKQEFGSNVLDLAIDIEGHIEELKQRPIMPFGLRDNVIAVIDQ